MLRVDAGVPGADAACGEVCEEARDPGVEVEQSRVSLCRSLCRNGLCLVLVVALERLLQRLVCVCVCVCVCV